MKVDGLSNLSPSRKIIQILLIVILCAPIAKSFDFNAIQEEQHNCSMWAVISDSLVPGIVYNQLVTMPNSLKNLSQRGNMDGWGIACYQNAADSVAIFRGALAACNDTSFDNIARGLDTTGVKIILAHVRNCTVGCCCHECETIPDPHPFVRHKNGRYWTFEHNGGVSVEILLSLIGTDYLAQNPLTGSGIPQCNPADTNLWVDSELYFLYLMKMIEQNNWNVFDGITSAIANMIYSGAYYGGINFILSDGHDIWAFRYGNTLCYTNNLIDGYSAIATKFPSSDSSGWRALNEYDMAYFQRGSAPVITNYLSLFPCIYLRGDLNADRRVTAGDVTFGVRYFKGLGASPPDSCFSDSVPGNHYLYMAGDVNGDCLFRLSDITRLVVYFNGLAYLYNCRFFPLP
jgi:predicted glutamine amidotransferase